MKTAAIYIRVSTDAQTDGYSLEMQTKALREYCKQNRIEIHNIYSDEGISGKNIEQRPGVQRLIADASRNNFDITLVWKLSRLTRSLRDLIYICDTLEKHHVALKSHTEPFDSSTPIGKLVLMIIGAVAEFERETICENVCQALLERAQQGKPTSPVILGYNRLQGDQLDINESEAEIIRFIFKSYIKTKNFLKVAQMCEEQNFNGKRGRPIVYASQIKTILTRKTYCGYNHFRGVWYPSNHLPIIDEKIFNKVQKIIEG